jgi:tetratricopeptide (TPR) repeat protein
VPDERQPRKPRTGGRPAAQSSGGRPSSAARSAGRSTDRRSDGRAGGSSGRKDGRSGAKDGAKREYSRPRRDERTAEERSESQARYDGPPIPEDITGKELDRSVQAQLKSLPEKLGQRVARHLVAAGLLIESEPRTAYEHTLAARARASRLAVVREAVGEAAYAAGEYAEALAELRAAKRMNGAQDYVAMMADCERALGRPDRALALVRNAPREKLSPALQAELTIVEAGARRDRGEVDAALRTLETSHINSKSREPWVARLRYAYADALVQAGRAQDALTWFHRAEAVDGEQNTDAADRAAELEKTLDQGK